MKCDLAFEGGGQKVDGKSGFGGFMRCPEHFRNVEIDAGGTLALR